MYSQLITIVCAITFQDTKSAHWGEKVNEALSMLEVLSFPTKDLAQIIRENREAMREITD